MFQIPEGCKPVPLLTPAADAAGRTSTVYPSLKNCKRAWIVAHIEQGNAATIALTPVQASAVAGTGTKVLTNAVPIWANQDCVASDTLVRQTDAANFTTSAAVKEKQVIFQIDPAACMDIDNATTPFDCIGLTTGASNAANITEATLWCEMKYASATPPSCVTN